MNQIEPTLLSLDPAAARAFDALADYFERLHDLGVNGGVAQPHVEARTHRYCFAEKAWNFGAMVLARAAGEQNAPEEDALTHEAHDLLKAVTREVRAFRHAIQEPLELDDTPPIRLRATKRKPREHYMESAAALLSEIAREERGIDATFDTGPDGQPVILAMPSDPAVAFARSFFSLMDILEIGTESLGLDSAEADQLVSLEREASAWWFGTRSTAALSKRDELGQQCREQEFSFFDRKTAVLGETLASAAARRLPWNTFTRRERALVEGIGRGVCGFFVVRQRRGPIIVLEDIATGARYESRDYVEPAPEERCVIAGRLIPIPEIGWLRSPGTIIWDAASDAALSATAKVLRQRAQREAYRSMVVEIEISARRGQKSPRFVPPTPSGESAAELLQDFSELAMEQAVEMERDEVLGAWIRALHEQGRSR